MSRSQRLLDLLQLLRNHRFPVPGAQLAATLGISLRTLYRDIATLQQQGADIAGEPGMGYVLKPGFTLPPLMFSEEEIEALVLGSRWVASRTDTGLSQSAKSALSKIAAVLPEDLRHSLDSNGLMAAPSASPLAESVDFVAIRRAIRHELTATLTYRDGKDQSSRRVIWPFLLGYFDNLHILGAWCELRGDFRHFRTDRIISLELNATRYPRRRAALIKQWREQQFPDRPAQ
ncbi:YafY family transcriptional regulator [Erwinia sp. INIA-01]|uniref:helix-turn-helix transcriptional regulator n=1 Tax=Erwinia sp. INIA01 TaxID=2991500 RepID=UPI0022247F1C|nr:YafY family protein [Erwinia sp. INIA01]MCW1876672.1 YafY family transcriptional regulator [Erwinia sp. INIA01]